MLIPTECHLVHLAYVVLQFALLLREKPKYLDVHLEIHYELKIYLALLLSLKIYYAYSNFIS